MRYVGAYPGHYGIRHIQAIPTYRVYQLYMIIAQLLSISKWPTHKINCYLYWYVIIVSELQ